MLHLKNPRRNKFLWVQQTCSETAHTTSGFQKRWSHAPCTPTPTPLPQMTTFELGTWPKDSRSSGLPLTDNLVLLLEKWGWGNQLSALKHLTWIVASYWWALEPMYIQGKHPYCSKYTMNIQKKQTTEGEKEGLEDHSGTHSPKWETLRSLKDEERGLGFWHSNSRFSEAQLYLITSFWNSMRMSETVYNSTLFK